MELCSRAFMPAVWAALDAGPVVFGSVPVPRYGRSIPEVRRRLRGLPFAAVLNMLCAFFLFGIKHSAGQIPAAAADGAADGAVAVTVATACSDSSSQSRKASTATPSPPLPQVERLKARPDVEVVTVTKANRDELAGQLADALAARLQV